jgi:hypothetical protein
MKAPRGLAIRSKRKHLGRKNDRHIVNFADNRRQRFRRSNKNQYSAMAIVGDRCKDLRLGTIQRDRPETLSF